MTRYDPTSNEPLLVFVPTEHGALRHVDRGSGIVGFGLGGDDDQPDEAEQVKIWFEGNRHRYSNVVSFADRCAIAADRARTNYPTVARMTVPREALHPVGVYDPAHGVMLASNKSSRAIVAQWIDVDEAELDAELVRSANF